MNGNTDTVITVRQSEAVRQWLLLLLPMTSLCMSLFPVILNSLQYMYTHFSSSFHLYDFWVLVFGTHLIIQDFLFWGGMNFEAVVANQQRLMFINHLRILFVCSFVENFNGYIFSFLREGGRIIYMDISILINNSIEENSEGRIWGGVGIFFIFLFLIICLLACCVWIFHMNIWIMGLGYLYSNILFIICLVFMLCVLCFLDWKPILY